MKILDYNKDSNSTVFKLEEINDFKDDLEKALDKSFLNIETGELKSESKI